VSCNRAQGHQLLLGLERFGGFFSELQARHLSEEGLGALMVLSEIQASPVLCRLSFKKPRHIYAVLLVRDPSLIPAMLAALQWQHITLHLNVKCTPAKELPLSLVYRRKIQVEKGKD